MCLAHGACLQILLYMETIKQCPNRGQSESQSQKEFRCIYMATYILIKALNHKLDCPISEKHGTNA